MCAIAQHFGRPGTPTDQAWIESLFGHVKSDWPHLDRIADPAVFEGQFVPKSSDTELFGTNIGRAAPYPPAMSPKTPGGTECFGRQRAVRGLGSLFGGIFVTAWFPRRHTQGSAIASRRVRHDRWVQMREHEWPWEGWLSWPPACFHRLPSVGIGMRRRRRHDDIRRLQLRIKRPGWKTSHPGHQSVCAAGRGRKRTRLRPSEICRAYAELVVQHL